MIVDGKTFRGQSVRQEGKFLILETGKGRVYVNMDNATKPVEVIGDFSLPTGSANKPAVEPQMVGGIADFKAARNRQLENLMALPGGIEQE